MSTTAVIPNWNGEPLLKSLLAHLAAQTRPPSRILVIDNGSNDGSIATARAAGAEVIAFTENFGFARAVNAGITASTTDLVVIVNNDVEPAPDWLEQLESALAHESDAWFATGKLYTRGGQNLLDGTFDTLSRAACACRCGHLRQDGSWWNQPRRIAFAPLTAALFRRELFTRLGVLDERFESYLEDVDLGLRCALHGLSGCYVPGAIARHLGSATLGAWHPDTVRRIARNQVFLVAKHFPHDWALQYGWPILVGQLLWGFTAVRRGTGWAWVRGKYEGIRRFAELRQSQRKDEHFGAIIASSERLLHEAQWVERPDWYWRIYFTLT